MAKQIDLKVILSLDSSMPEEERDGITKAFDAVGNLLAEHGVHALVAMKAMLPAAQDALKRTRGETAPSESEPKPDEKKPPSRDMDCQCLDAAIGGMSAGEKIHFVAAAAALVEVMVNYGPVSLKAMDALVKEVEALLAKHPEATAAK